VQAIVVSEISCFSFTVISLDIWSRGVFFRLDSTQNRPVLYLSTLNHHVELDHRLARYR
jgi:hypothetical protein